MKPIERIIEKERESLKLKQSLLDYDAKKDLKAKNNFFYYNNNNLLKNNFENFKKNEDRNLKKKKIFGMNEELKVLKNAGFGSYFKNLRKEIIEIFNSPKELIEFDSLLQPSQFAELFNCKEINQKVRLSKDLNDIRNLNLENTFYNSKFYSTENSPIIEKHNYENLKTSNNLNNYNNNLDNFFYNNNINDYNDHHILKNCNLPYQDDFESYNNRSKELNFNKLMQMNLEINKMPSYSMEEEEQVCRRVENPRLLKKLKTEANQFLIQDKVQNPMYYEPELGYLLRQNEDQCYQRRSLKAFGNVSTDIDNNLSSINEDNFPGRIRVMEQQQLNKQFYKDNSINGNINNNLLDSNFLKEIFSEDQSNRDENNINKINMIMNNNEIIEDRNTRKRFKQNNINIIDTTNNIFSNPNPNQILFSTSNNKNFINTKGMNNIVTNKNTNKEKIYAATSFYNTDTSTAANISNYNFLNLPMEENNLDKNSFYIRQQSNQNLVHTSNSILNPPQQIKEYNSKVIDNRANIVEAAASNQNSIAANSIEDNYQLYNVNNSHQNPFLKLHEINKRKNSANTYKEEYIASLARQEDYSISIQNNNHEENQLRMTRNTTNNQQESSNSGGEAEAECNNYIESSSLSNKLDNNNYDNKNRGTFLQRNQAQLEKLKILNTIKNNNKNYDKKNSGNFLLERNAIDHWNPRPQVVKGYRSDRNNIIEGTKNENSYIKYAFKGSVGSALNDENEEGFIVRTNQNTFLPVNFYESEAQQNTNNMINMNTHFDNKANRNFINRKNASEVIWPERNLEEGYVINDAKKRVPLGDITEYFYN